MFAMKPSLRRRVSLHQGDLTELDVDAIVNAANETLLGGGGVDGAIHAAAGPGLLDECRGLGGCPTGEARITGGYSLLARHVIHAVGPIWKGGGRGEAEDLAETYHSALRLASERGLQTLAFPSISTGVYGYPMEQACRIALNEVAQFLDDHSLPEQIIFCTFGPEATETMRRVFAEFAGD